MKEPLEQAGLRARVDKALAGFLADRRTELLRVDGATGAVADAVEAFVLGGGKRLRPAFAYWGYRGAGGDDSDELVATVAALELVQASALIHDDVMDRSETRRGKPAIHRRFARLHGSLEWLGDPDQFGTGAAILLGDLCLVWSDQLLRTGGLDPDAVARARPVFDEMRAELTVGQYLDLHGQATGQVTPERATLVARLKSGRYSVERPLLLGAAMAGAGQELTAAYAGYGQPLGEAFQLRDDVLGVFGDPARTGKPAGDDLREGKRTYLVAAAFQTADPAGRAALAAGLGDPELDPAGVRRLREVIVASGALARTERRIAALTARALAALARGPVTPQAREVLTGLAGAATSRSG